ncbi:MAG: tetraacyldisaccharide 4'-kinase [Bacteroidales bacterium]|nr:tetraacyldisaccharide 4'-kinase [Bacteroidales bacterium]
MRRLLAPLSWLYAIVLFIRHKLYDWGLLKSRSFSVPTICVGNLSLGGTGKTPHTEYLIRLLKDIANVAVLSRGYGRKTEGFVLANEETTYEQIGDEPLQYHLKFNDITVAVDEDRCDGVTNLMRLEKSPDVIVLDDAYQHRKIKPGLNILLTEYYNIYKKDMLVPAGKLRDIKMAAKRADIIIVTKSPKVLLPYDKRDVVDVLNAKPYQQVFFTYIDFQKLNPINKTAKETALQDMKSVYLFCGIANPYPLEDYLKRKYNTLITKYFDDHHCFNDSDIDMILSGYDSVIGKNKIIVTTEKDLMRLTNSSYINRFDNVPLFTVPIEVRFNDEKEEETFKNLILNYVGKNS